MGTMGTVVISTFRVGTFWELMGTFWELTPILLKFLCNNFHECLYQIGLVR